MGAALYLPGATWRPVSYRAEAGRFPAPPLGWILHVVVGNGSPRGTFEHAPSGSRRFSTAWVAKDGSSEQYTELKGRPWAQGAGNPIYWAFETEGYPTEPLTDAQIATLAIWHNALGVIDALAEAPGQRGIGTHFMGGAAWGGHTCPDPAPGAGPRSRQRTAIIARARSLRAVTVSNPTPSMTPTPVATAPALAPTPLNPLEDDDMNTERALQAAYRQQVGRTPADTELDDRILRIALGQSTLAGEIAAIDRSTESNRYAVHQLYLELLKRDGSIPEWDYWISSAGNDVAKIRAGIIASDEYKKLHP